MPRNQKTPLIQKIAKQAFSAYRGPQAPAGPAGPAPPAGGEAAAEDRQAQLVSLVTALRAADLKIAPRRRKVGQPALPGPSGPPVAYMHICETEVFSMGVFLLRTGASIPLHDHPGMNGMLKVLYGKVSVRCFDKLEDQPAVGAALPAFQPPLAAPQLAALRRSVLRSVAEYSESSGPCLLTPLRDNLHQIDALEGPAAFLDILAPPYNPEDGRDCHYYKVLHTTADGGGAGGGGGQETWLLEIPQPEDFWCGGEAYPGPVVSV